MTRPFKQLIWAAAINLVTGLPALSTPLLWTLQDVSFADQGTAFGSFIFDDQINNGSRVLAVDITTTDGSSLQEATTLCRTH